MKIYTKTGDDGNTGLQGGRRISKSHPRIASYGAVDEANAALGIALSSWHDCPEEITSVLVAIQRDLFVVGADLSNPDLQDLCNRVTPGMAESLERTIDRFDSKLPALSSFVLPSGGSAASHLHHVRAVVRRAESLAVKLSETDEINLHCIIYLNRLSDLLFVLARTASRQDGHGDVLWRPNEPTKPDTDRSSGP